VLSDPTNLTGTPGANFGFPVVDGEEAANNHAGNSGRSTAIEEQNAEECNQQPVWRRRIPQGEHQGLLLVQLLGEVCDQQQRHHKYSSK
jgi:hypothetical protein